MRPTSKKEMTHPDRPQPRRTHWEVAMSRSVALKEPTVAEKTRSFTPARIVALGLCAVFVFGLFFLRFAPEGKSVSVPAGGEGRRSCPPTL
jgi:hypothetical protein